MFSAKLQRTCDHNERWWKDCRNYRIFSRNSHNWKWRNATVLVLFVPVKSCHVLMKRRRENEVFAKNLSTDGFFLFFRKNSSDALVLEPNVFVCWLVEGIENKYSWGKVPRTNDFEFRIQSGTHDFFCVSDATTASRCGCHHECNISLLLLSFCSKKGCAIAALLRA